jgi:hypothetical protein
MAMVAGRCLRIVSTACRRPRWDVSVSAESEAIALYHVVEQLFWSGFVSQGRGIRPDVRLEVRLNGELLASLTPTDRCGTRSSNCASWPRVGATFSPPRRGRSSVAINVFVCGTHEYGEVGQDLGSPRHSPKSRSKIQLE